MPKPEASNPPRFESRQSGRPEKAPRRLPQEGSGTRRPGPPPFCGARYVTVSVPVIPELSWNVHTKS